MNAMPPLITLDYLASLPRWVVWRNEERNGDITKVPYTPGTRKRAHADLPETWRPRTEAVEWTDMIVGPLGGGVGLELGDLGDGRAIGGIDLDTCRQNDGKLAEWAREVIGQFGSYSEVSPSGTGVKTYFRYDAAALPELLRAMQTEGGKQWKQGKGKHPPSIELYVAGRYFAVTGNQLSETPPDLRFVPVEALLQLILTDGPAFAAAGKTTVLKSTSKATTIKDLEVRAGNDSSRSGTAFRIGARARREGRTFDDMCEVIRTDPETAAWYAEKGLAASGRELHRIWERTDPSSIANAEWTEDGVAQAFVRKHSDDLRYCNTTGAWFQWTEKAWRQERTKLAFAWARAMCREVRSEADDKAKVALSKASASAAVERFAQADRAFSVTSEIWDRDPYLMGTPAGTLDLRTGEVRTPIREDHITRLTAVAPAAKADCPLWLGFLKQATGDNEHLTRFLQAWCGYTLTGLTREHALLFIFGPGGNGKSVFLNTIARILNEYARVAAMETFTASQTDRHPTDLAMLRGARMVCASETEEGRAWAETRIKQLTGGDPISARFMRQDFFTFTPEFKLVVIGNYKPVLRNVDEAARRRFNVVPFTLKPEQPDRELENKLEREWPGILRWMIDGCLDWQANGLIRPAVVLNATAEYFSEQDSIRQWIESECQTGSTASDTVANLFRSWSEYAVANGERPGTTKWLSQTLVRHGFEQVKNTPNQNGKRGFLGIAAPLPSTQRHWQDRE